MHKETITIRMLGARGSGKTSFLYKSYFKYTNEPNTHFSVIPTPTHNVEIIPYQSCLFELWDLAEIGASLNYVKENTHVLIYMVDSVEYQREAVATKSKENMIWLLENFSQALEQTIILTVANKQDQPEAMDLQDIGNSWANDKTLMGLLKGHHWRIFSCDALTGQGFDAIFDYIHQRLLNPDRSSLSRPVSLISPSPSVISNHTVTPWESLLNPYHLSDQEFKQGFYSLQKTFLFFDQGCLVRIIYLALLESNKMAIAPFLQQLQHVVMHIDQENRSIMYSETQALFWIQMVSFALLKWPLLEGQENDFEAFSNRCQLNDDCWREYYSQRLFYSEKGCSEFLPPDKKSLPNAFKSSSLALKGSGLRIDYQVL
ncbi:P-loop containing nucleoside triphosphate hydrolase protein [Choanephora cucurbitarum]|nr:P-loop containing nucleoside triphosphate hydrolase protein [Choanephora cucurbitarum]